MNPTDGLQRTYDIANINGVIHSTFLTATLPFRYIRTTGWQTDATEIPDMAGTTREGRFGTQREALLIRDGLVAMVELSGGEATLRGAASTAEAIEEVFAEIRGLLPATAPDPGKPMVPVTFWSNGTHGPTRRTRRLSVPPWEDCHDNYPHVTADALRPLMETFEPGAGGQLILWHGPPGTGKTWALRSLAWEWREWCAIHYITDPEKLFGAEAAYLLDVLLADDSDEGHQPLRSLTEPLFDAPPVKADPRAADGRWRLLVLEDTGEMMSSDARERAGAGLGRLLNVVDGMIGQGLKVLVLVTTNEEVRKLHPAIARTGRCAAQVRFDAMPVSDAQAWLEEHGGDPETLDGRGKPLTVSIADLFALRAGAETSIDREPAPVGFSA